MESYLIWSNEHNAWWRPNHNSYTEDVSRAGRYSLEEAIEICNGGNINWGIESKLPNELPIKVEAAMLLKGPHSKSK